MEADHLDQAQQLTQQLNDAFVSNQRLLGRPEQVQNDDGTWPHSECACGELLGARMELGKIRCLACQLDLERERRCSR